MRLAVFPQSLLYVLLSLSTCWQASATFMVSPDGLQLVQCSQVTLLWTEEPPIQLWVAPDREVKPGDPTLETLGPVNATFLRWTVNLPVGQNVSFTYIRLAEPLTLLSSAQEYTVVAGDSSACLPEAYRSFSSSSAGASSSAKPTTSEAPTSEVPPPSGSSPTSRGADATSTGLSTVAPAAVSTPPSAGTAPNSGSSTKAGAIAGGIAGGLLALCLGLLLLLRRRRILLRLQRRASIARTVDGTEDGPGAPPTRSRSPPTAQATGSVTVYPFQAVASPASHPPAQKWASWSTPPPLHVPDQPQDVPGSSVAGSDSLWSPARTDTGSAWADLQTEVLLLRTDVERFQEERRRQLGESPRYEPARRLQY